jgi:hypothetical protein
MALGLAGRGLKVCVSAGAACRAAWRPSLSILTNRTESSQREDDAPGREPAVASHTRPNRVFWEAALALIELND